HYTLPSISGPIRIEFTGLASTDFTAPFGSSSGTSVQFVTAPASNVNFGVNFPSDYCQTNPQYFATCFLFSDNINGANKDEPAGAAAPFNTHSSSMSSLTLKPKAKEIGAVWGTAYHAKSEALFTSSYLKQNTGFGPNATGVQTTGGIYKIIKDGSGNALTSLFIDIETSMGTGANPHPNPTDVCNSAVVGTSNSACWFHDMNAFGKQGKWSLGDLDISPDQTALFTVNMYDRSLIKIPMTGDPNNPVAGTPIKFPLSALFTDCSASGDWRPFGLGKKGTKMYLGAVCSAESTQKAADLQALVYEFDPNNPTSFTLIANFDLDYERKGIIRNCSPSCISTWNPWTDNFTQIDVYTRGTNPKKIDAVHPMPMLSDIEFFGEDMILGVRDRAADMFGNGLGSPINMNDNALYWAVSAGDILRAARNADGTYSLENAGVTGIYTSAGNYSGGIGDGVLNSGPGGKEFYSEGFGVHSELSQGGMAQIPGSTRVLSTFMNPFIATSSSGGVVGLNNVKGKVETGNVYFGSSQDYDFSKANGMGDVELLCALAPIEIGNRVWLDTDKDGAQDANEAGIDGIVLKLYEGTTEVGTTTTANGGQYYFTNANVTGGVKPNTAYEIRIESAQQPLSSLGLTQTDGIANDLIDNDGIQSGSNAIKTFTTGSNGQNNHSYDFGFAPKASVGNFVWDDVNRDGVQNAQEIGVPNVVVQLYKSDNTLVATDTTDAAGKYLFTSLDANDYYIKFDTASFPHMYLLSPQNAILNDSLDSDANAAGVTPVFTLEEGEQDTTIDLGIHMMPPAIGNYVWLDANNNGIQDAGEKGIQGIILEVYKADGTLAGTDTTDAAGSYFFGDLFDGDYYVKYVTIQFQQVICFHPSIKAQMIF
ncbi:MAG: hypothetical protein HC817_11200, partial [Saprospiraceae bacterium]|nr:hypothetical protein [Saprospiraceae bacterium]